MFKACKELKLLIIVLILHSITVSACPFEKQLPQYAVFRAEDIVIVSVSTERLPLFPIKKNGFSESFENASRQISSAARLTNVHEYHLWVLFVAVLLSGLFLVLCFIRIRYYSEITDFSQKRIIEYIYNISSLG